MERNLLNERFITIEKLADGGLSHKLSGLTVKFSFAETFLGEVLVASTLQGVCYMAFVVRGRDMAEIEMMNRFPGVFLRKVRMSINVGHWLLWLRMRKIWRQCLCI